MIAAAKTALVIDNHPLLLEGVKQLFELDKGFRLVGAATTSKEGVRLARRYHPDIILLDLNMGDTHGLDALSQLKALELDSLVIVLTVSNVPNDMVDALKRGADGYLLKDMEPEEILEKLRSAGDGQIVVSEAVSNILTRIMRQEHQRPSLADARLTRREGEILGLIARGMSNKSISNELKISDGTVKVHVKNLLRKINARSRLEAAIWAIEQGYARSK